jgi:uncharacterized SAM-binding protein YcdF (DUF218 family)
MLFFFRKLVEAMFMPVGLAGLLAILGLLLRRRWLVVCAVVVLFFFSSPIVSRMIMQPLEAVYPAQTVDAAPTADAIVVLSGGIVRGRSPAGVQWGESANRYFTGLDLAASGKAPLLVLSAGGPPSGRAIPRGEILQRAAVSRGLAPNRIVVTQYVLTTEEEARAVSALPGIHSVLLVTSAFHMPRAAFLFRARGLQVFPFPTDQRVFGPSPDDHLKIIPDSVPLHESEMAMREYYGLAIYRTLHLIHPGSF